MKATFHPHDIKPEELFVRISARSLTRVKRVVFVGALYKHVRVQ